MSSRKGKNEQIVSVSPEMERVLYGLHESGRTNKPEVLGRVAMLREALDTPPEDAGYDTWTE